ncbi:MAG: lipoyl(octanoyl) transferase LipB [Desulfarculaceae bacterium]|nr:lipoyl(octanoyl) transferase LipB [Desulfarculaceae bacterium]MCF8070852.1 lipoyl(octanoyl) transferase LipB [Desulfarculaceae bacterium]MCF8102290.1 lipoyl(octanoyl) transferase LipB [Desulfarculaceae bacterium]MCF8118027.1 lipoyl(octanoyl) transferase LipB [Desulfarculaceae bacterium]
MTPYPEALERMRRQHAERAQGRGRDAVICCEHPPVFTLGRHAEPGHVLLPPEELAAKGFAMHQVERGGQVTYHGPGQAVVYLIIDLKARGLGVRRLVEGITQAICRSAARFGVRAAGDPDRPGAWVQGRKLAAIGLAIQRGVTMHGLALNVSTDLSRFKYIRPCGLDAPITSLSAETGLVPELPRVYDSLYEELVRELA